MLWHKYINQWHPHIVLIACSDCLTREWCEVQKRLRIMLIEITAIFYNLCQIQWNASLLFIYAVGIIAFAVCIWWHARGLRIICNIPWFTLNVKYKKNILVLDMPNNFKSRHQWSNNKIKIKVYYKKFNDFRSNGPWFKKNHPIIHPSL